MTREQLKAEVAERTEFYKANKARADKLGFVLIEDKAADLIIRMDAFIDELKDSQWQLIETIPKDGTKILLCSYSDDEYTSIHMAYYSKGVDGLYRWYGEHDGYETYWMPFPTPPKQGK